jgi:predicted O-methyltransferase YrrM
MNIFSRIKRHIPKSVKLKLKKAILPIAVKMIHLYPSNKKLPSSFISLLHFSWGNSGFAANKDYLKYITNFLSGKDYNVLECGSGISTVLLGIINKKSKLNVYSLEHNFEWYKYTKSILKLYNIEKINLIHAPLIKYDTFEWYDISKTKLPNQLDLILCDGPPEGTLGGRYGLVPLIGSAIKKQCVILLDDVDRISEKQIIKKWSEIKNFNTKYSDIDKYNRQFVELTVQ